MKHRTPYIWQAVQLSFQLTKNLTTAWSGLLRGDIDQYERFVRSSRLDMESINRMLDHEEKHVGN